MTPDSNTYKIYKTYEAIEVHETYINKFHHKQTRGNMRDSINSSKTPTFTALKALSKEI